MLGTRQAFSHNEKAWTEFPRSLGTSHTSLRSQCIARVRDLRLWENDVRCYICHIALHESAGFVTLFSFAKKFMLKTYSPLPKIN